MRFLKNKLAVITVITVFILVITVSLTAEGRTRPTAFESIIGSTITPVQKIFYKTGEFFKNTFSTLFELKNMKAENKALKEEITKLREENRKLYQMALENNRLRTLLEFKNNNPQYKYIGANITGKDPGNWFDIFTIDKGSKHGVEVNDSVITGQGLVGRVIEVGSNYSKVMAIIDERSSVSIIVNRTRDTGIVSGSVDSELIAIMPLESDIVKGDDIITSNFSTFEEGLYVGKVESVEKQERKLQKIVKIKTSVDFKRLEEVFVIKKIDVVD
ncbi:rod shape-determining protein MreC [Lutispora thermophila]|uniref:Cell shape-determining protein MreC n=1 Tax=Lutispora thermophila DSM 19022 TaxID=1122184 RepID=A0A1M6FSH9_9FIRM|nr:rod shape-determining protein MreC [Lutispora thermophila]SHJ00627.1 rod shape-determining protein MreC [Lutispora thermophila DSM 19022]